MSPHQVEGSRTQALIKKLREHGLSQSEISRLTNIPQPRLSRWESGDVAAGADDALRLHALLEEWDRERGAAIGSAQMDRRNSARVSPYAGSDIDRRAAAEGQ